MVALQVFRAIHPAGPLPALGAVPIPPIGSRVRRGVAVAFLRHRRNGRGLHRRELSCDYLISFQSAEEESDARRA